MGPEEYLSSVNFLNLDPAEAEITNACDNVFMHRRTRSVLDVRSFVY